MARRRRVRGDRAFKKLIKRLPDAVRAEAVTMLEEGGSKIRGLQLANALEKSGATREAISVRVLRGGLQLKVGIVGRPANRRVFYARIIEKGRDAKTVTVHRLSGAHRDTWRNRVVAGTARLARKPGDLGVTYQLRVRARAAHPFIYSPEVLAEREKLGGSLNNFWSRVLSAASQGASDE